jgi:ATP-dependent DNA helicase PIF1
MILEKIGENLLKVKVPLPNNSFSIHLIPRLELVPSDDLTPFRISRTQFPVRPAFACTINKAQGQSLKNVGLFLLDPCFAHGQLYVGVSRATSPDGLSIVCQQHEDGSFITRNVVYREAVVAQNDRMYMEE